ncbi:acyl-CoA dehydrogenase domain-containing protein [Caldalkalibacillus thermarum TA2.A1]|uniref:Acyl-CoA dehydrogenase domain-containing protein n=1 Tax=Caldalkalibacillus thermarum (strain TA2.A1) TaxID=986075 RepID=F5LB08_CALTT|nr:acyl-CoA dehydrogenase family protein [Caldalkalibacillus thermarum]EGL81547.1 acyl-CoA dehydrogenase domain-containing protein [Caldalkalibacillus thermarum TA2.A1]QZT33839.1 acyl-CoA dehydrogenase family protein [Caldalkalibacillus thermarum TA2.A1]
MSDVKSFVRGGGFLIEDVTPEQVLTPEEFTEEHRMIAKTTEEFVLNEVRPVLEEIENQNFEHTVRLLRKAGELGLLGADIPEKYGGLGLDKISSSLITEYLSPGRSFALSFGAHVGIGTLPIVFFGNEEQKKKYLPALATGEKIAAYALTEPSSGSDALGAKTVAKLSDCGKYYILTGEKQWITNSGFADVFIVYAKVDGEKFTAFIVERDYEGVSTGPEEKKMGIKGSSTRTLILDEAKVPVENVLGEIGKGHVIAFNILNIGRYKLAVGCVGSTKRLLEISVKYAKERKQFKQPIANFNLIKNKLANMAIRTFVNESMVYRTTGLFEEKLGRLSEEEMENGLEVAKSIAEYAIECSINKVYGSEALDYVVDEAVQIHGGYGYMSEYEVENAYRDSRINRIFEGTNEINRLLIPATLMRKVMKGELDLLSKASGLQEELMMLMPQEPDESELLGKEKQHLEMAKKLFLMVAGTGVQKYQQELEKEQELLAHIADMIIEIYAMESAILRTEKAVLKNGEAKEQQKLDYTRVYVQEALQRLEGIARESLAAMEEGDTLRTMLAIVKKLTRHNPINTIEIKRRIANRIIEAEKYVV